MAERVNCALQVRKCWYVVWVSLISVYFSVCSSFGFDSLFVMNESAVINIWKLLWNAETYSIYLSLSVCLFFCTSICLSWWKMTHAARWICAVQPHPSLICSLVEQPLCSPCHPVVLVCFFLFCQVSIRSLAQSVCPVLLEASQLSGTVRTAAIAASETAGQVKKLWVISTNSMVSSVPVRTAMIPVTFEFLS